LEQAAGYPTEWSLADARYNEGLLSAFRFGPMVGPWWKGTNSFRQGAASSVRRVTLLMAIWVRRQTRTIPEALVGNFYDDCLTIADTQQQRQTSMNESDKFDRLTGQRVGHKKIVGFCSPDNPDSCLTSRKCVLATVAV
jgi:hypothetical protein